MMAGGGMRRTVLVGIAVAALAGCDDPQPPDHLRIAGADPQQGRALIKSYECGACHKIDGIWGADGVVGPPLDNYAQRVLLAGVMPNVPRNLVPWIVDPPALVPDTGMPSLGVSEAEARHMAAYLYTLGADKAQVYPPESLPIRGQRGIVEIPSSPEEREPTAPAGPVFKPLVTGPD